MMRVRVVIAVFALFLALHPLSTWTLLGVFGSDHVVRLAAVDGGLNLILVHSEDSPGEIHHHHTAADRILATLADHAAMGARNHVIRSIHSDVTPPKRAAIATPLMIAQCDLMFSYERSVSPRASSTLPARLPPRLERHLRFSESSV